MNNQNTSRIVRPMKRTSILLALCLLGAFPVVAQTAQLGIIAGGSRRFVDNNFQPAGEAIDDTFSFSNTSFELFYRQNIDPATSLKFKLGRLEGNVAFPTGTRQRTDTTGEVQHASLLVQYEFDEPYGSTGIFAGPGLYRQTADGFDSESSWGLQAGLNADFPITRRYGAVVEVSYHWVHFEVRPRYLTLGAGLRVSF